MSCPTVAIGLPTYLRNGELQDTIGQLLRQSVRPDEIIVVDQTPRHEPEIEEFLRHCHSRRHIVWLREENPSLTAARNRVLAEATSEVVLFVDDDVLLPHRFVEAHVRHFRRLAVDLVSGPVMAADESSRRMASQMQELGGNEVDIGTGGCPDIHGGNHSVRRSTAIRVGGYDEQFVGPAHYEENDFARRLCKSGAVCIFDPDAWLVHLKAPTGGCRVPGNRHWPEWHKAMNIMLFTFRHVSAAREKRALLTAALRSGPLRKENVLYLWRQPAAWANFALAVLEARKRASRCPASPFTRSGRLNSPVSPPPNP
jgi:GT2 family glycosyltransferase